MVKCRDCKNELREILADDIAFIDSYYCDTCKMDKKPYTKLQELEDELAATKTFIGM